MQREGKGWAGLTRSRPSIVRQRTSFSYPLQCVASFVFVLEKKSLNAANAHEIMAGPSLSQLGAVTGAWFCNVFTSVEWSLIVLHSGTPQVANAVKAAVSGNTFAERSSMGRWRLVCVCSIKPPPCQRRWIGSSFYCKLPCLESKQPLLD